MNVHRNINLSLYGDYTSNLKGLLSGVGHITRVVRDAERSCKFYVAILGAEVLNRPNILTNGYWLWLGNTQLHLVQSDLVVTPDHPNAGTKVNHISFEVTDLIECEKRLRASNMKFTKSSVIEGECEVSQIFFQDPDGHWIELCDCQQLNSFVFKDIGTVNSNSIPIINMCPIKQEAAAKINEDHSYNGITTPMSSAEFLSASNIELTYR